MDRGHFTVRRLERKYGEQAIRAEYQRLAGVPVQPYSATFGTPPVT